MTIDRRCDRRLRRRGSLLLCPFAQLLISVFAENQNRFLAVCAIQRPDFGRDTLAASALEVEGRVLVHAENAVFEVQWVDGAVEWLKPWPSQVVLLRDDLQGALAVGSQEHAAGLSGAHWIVDGGRPHLVPARHGLVRLAGGEPCRFIVTLGRDVPLDRLGPLQDARHLFRLQPYAAGAARSQALDQLAAGDRAALE